MMVADKGTRTLLLGLRAQSVGTKRGTHPLPFFSSFILKISLLANSSENYSASRPTHPRRGGSLPSREVTTFLWLSQQEEGQSSTRQSASSTLSSGQGCVSGRVAEALSSVLKPIQECPKACRNFITLAMEGEFQPSPPPLLCSPVHSLHYDKATTRGSYSTGRYAFPSHRKNRSHGSPVVFQQPKLILFPCGETGSSQTSSSRPAIGPAPEEVANPSTEASTV